MTSDWRGKCLGVHPALRLAYVGTCAVEPGSVPHKDDEGIIPPPALSRRTGLPQRCLGNGVPRKAQRTGSREVGIGCVGAVLPRRRGCARSASRPSGSFRRATEKVSHSSPGGSKVWLQIALCPLSSPNPEVRGRRGGVGA